MMSDLHLPTFEAIPKGTVLEYLTTFSNTRTVIVTESEPGRFDATELRPIRGATVWAYNDQVTRILRVPK